MPLLSPVFSLPLDSFETLYLVVPSPVFVLLIIILEAVPVEFWLFPPFLSLAPNTAGFVALHGVDLELSVEFVRYSRV